MRTVNAFLWATLALALSACTTTRQVAHNDFQPPQGNYRLIVMQPDVSVGLLTAGGAVEPREDWTNQARQHVLNAVANQQRTRGGQTKIAHTREETGVNPELVTDLVQLHGVVGESIKIHKFAMLNLPTKQDTFDWTLGERAVEFGSATGFDYALFLKAQDSFSSGGRVALQLASALACGFGACVMPTGGQQIAFASLVDLKSGQVVWFNTLFSEVGDIRTPDGADKMVKGLLDSMKAGAPPKEKKNTKRTT